MHLDRVPPPTTVPHLTSVVSSTPLWYSEDNAAPCIPYVFWIEVTDALPETMRRLAHPFIDSVGQRMENNVQYQLLIAGNYQVALLLIAILSQQGYSWGGRCPFQFTD